MIESFIDHYWSVCVFYCSTLVPGIHSHAFWLMIITLAITSKHFEFGFITTKTLLEILVAHYSCILGNFPADTIQHHPDILFCSYCESIFVGHLIIYLSSVLVWHSDRHSLDQYVLTLSLFLGLPSCKIVPLLLPSFHFFTMWPTADFVILNFLTIAAYDTSPLLLY